MGTNSCRVGVSVCRPPEGVLVLVGMSNRRAGVNTRFYAA